MEKLNDEKFIKGVESLINPNDVTDLLFLQKLKQILPSRVLKKLLYLASRKTPYIGFVIEPYSLFLFYKLKDIERAKSMLPDRYELAKTKIFVDDEPDYYLGIGNLGTRASTFWGTRQESYLVARDKETGLLSWIFIDILSNTLIALPPKGITNPNTKRALFTTHPSGKVILDVQEKKTNRQLVLSGSIKNGEMRKLDQDLWLMGNTSIGHCTEFSDGNDNPFAVIFDPAEVEEALDIPCEDIQVTENNLFPELSEPELSKVVCFPYAQHYFADSPGCQTVVKDREDLVRLYNQLGASEGLKTFTAKTIKLQLLAGLGLSALIVLILVILF